MRPRLNPFVADDTPGVGKAGQDVFMFKPGISFEECLDRIARREHTEDVLNGQPPAAHNGFAAENLRVDSDALEKFILIHHVRL